MKKMRKLSFTVAAAAVVVGMVLLCTSCINMLTYSTGTYKWSSDKKTLTITSNVSSFELWFAGNGVKEVELKKKTVKSVDYLTNANLYLDVRETNPGSGIWEGIYYLKGSGLRYVSITLEKYSNRCKIQPSGFRGDSKIQFPEDLTIKGLFKGSDHESNPEVTYLSGMPTYADQFIKAIVSGSLKTKWIEYEVETFADSTENTVGNVTTITWKGSSEFFIKNPSVEEVYYKKILTKNGSGVVTSGRFEIFIKKGTVLRWKDFKEN